VLFTFVVRNGIDSSGSPSPAFREALRDDLQKIAADTGQVWLEHVALWLQKRKSEALTVLVKPVCVAHLPLLSFLSHYCPNLLINRVLRLLQVHPLS
jgi:hypothetical protein